MLEPLLQQRAQVVAQIRGRRVVEHLVDARLPVFEEG